MTFPFDALVIGGGPAGSSAAAFMARLGWRVALVEKSCFPRRKVCGEFVSGTNRFCFEKLGVLEAFEGLAGPEVREVGLFAANAVLRTEMPKTASGDIGYGRALSRDQLDLILLNAALRAGAKVWQPWKVCSIEPKQGGYVCRIAARGKREELAARIVIVAQGSWSPGGLIDGQSPSRRASDLFAFKAHFQNSCLPAGLMPLIAFPGGYGGMVHCNGDRLSLSCCIRRDVLERCRQEMPEQSAGRCLWQHVMSHCDGVRGTLERAQLDGPWMAAGPIRPGIRVRGGGAPGMFLVGNAAGEAHPVIAEGISMAIQSAWHLSSCLASDAAVLSSNQHLTDAGHAYAEVWRSAFRKRIFISAAVAHWAMWPWAVLPALPLLRLWPGILSTGARLSGKTDRVRPEI